MKLNYVRVEGYGKLRQFAIRLDESQLTTVLLGRNGTGKSYLIEAIVEIFRDLESGAPPTFAYTMEYTCRGRRVQVDADPRRPTRRIEILVDSLPVSQLDFQRNSDALLPSYVFAYYSGWSPRLERQFDRTTRKYYEQMLNSPDRQLPLRRMFFCRKEYSQLVLLAFFLSDSPESRAFLGHYLGIRRFDAALFVMKAPWWRVSSPTAAARREGDPRFWHARGAFRWLLARLWERALAPIRSTEAIERDVRKQGETTERLYLYIKSATELSALVDAPNNAKALFGYLEGLFLSDLIDEVRITVERVDGSRIRFAQMSEGEQQLLTVLGLLLFTQDDEALYLLDEPDTHLNPVWTHELMTLLDRTVTAKNGHLLVATHNPLMIGSLRKEQVRVFDETADGLSAAEPAHDPLGLGVEGLLRSDVYGLRSTLAPEIVQAIDEQNRLLSLRTRSSDEEDQLRAVTDRLQELHLTVSHPNPLFGLFAKAVAAQTEFQKPVLSKEELAAQEQMASQILEEIIDKPR